MSPGTRAFRRLGAVALVSIAAAMPRGDARASTAIRLVVEPAADTWEPGQPLQVEIRLRSVRGEPVSAERPYDVQVSIENGRGAIARFATGDSVASVTVTTPDAEGICEIRATNAEMLPGARAVLIARRRAGARGSAAPLEGALPRTGALAPRATAIGQRVDPPPPSQAPPAAHHVLWIKALPEEVLANGHDPSRIEVWINPPPDTQRVVILSTTPPGVLDRQELTIDPEKGCNSANLTAPTPGKVEVEVEWLGPRDIYAASDEAEVEFRPAVEGFNVAFDKSKGMTLLDSGKITASLTTGTGRDRTTIRTDRERTVTLTLDTGSAKLASSTITIPAGQSQGSVYFTPETLGQLAISATSEELPSPEEPQTIVVSFPSWPLVGCVIGGGLGGVLFTYQRHWRLRRILLRMLVGIFTGTFFYFLVVIFGKSTSFSSLLYISNPLYAFVIAGVGGWAGTAVFVVAARRLGAGSDTTEKPPQGLAEESKG